MENKIFWELSTNHANYILQLLHQRPYQEVAALVEDLIKQSNGNKPDLKEVKTGGPTQGQVN